MNIYLVRHAKAGKRLPGYQDRYRPLIAEGRTQADNIAAFLAAEEITSIRTSPAVRCQQTVEPLANKLELPANDDDTLWEDAMPNDVLALMDATADEHSVLCTHGNLIPAVIHALKDSGVQVDHGAFAKGSIWVVKGEPGAWSAANYLAPEALA